MSISYLKVLCVALLILLTGCSPPAMLMKSGVVDPSLTWDAVTTDCTGAAITGVKYNVYAVSGPGPIPTIASADEVPCGIIQLASGVPLNATPIAIGTSYQATVANGVWTFAVEALDASGNRSALSNQVTKTVQGRPGKPANFKVTWDEFGLYLDIIGG
jgi:hypothetical protein